MKKLILSLTSLVLASTASMAQNSEYTATQSGYTYEAAWADCMNERGFAGGTAGKLDALGYAGGELTITTQSGHGTYQRSPTFLPLIDKTQIVYSTPTNCSNALPGVDLSVVPASQKKVVIRMKASSAVTVRFNIGSGQGFPCYTNLAEVDLAVTTSYQDFTIDLSVDANILSNGTCASGGKMPLTAVTYVGISPDLANGTFVGTVSITGYKIGDVLPLTTGVSSADVNNSLIAVYPNPAKDQINVDLSSMNASEAATVKIMNSNGMVVYEGTAANTNATISTAALNKGIYMVQVSAGNKVSNKKLVIE